MLQLYQFFFDRGMQIFAVSRFLSCFFFFFFNDPATTEIYTLSLHDALPIFIVQVGDDLARGRGQPRVARACEPEMRSEEHTSELQSRQYLVCRLLLEKKKNTRTKRRFFLR